jgi:Domain of unknown function DUF11
MRRWNSVVLSALMLVGVAASPAAAQTTASSLVFEFRQVTAVAHEQTVVTYEALIRNDGTEPGGYGDLYLDVPDGFGEAIQYDPGLCLRYENQDVDCDTFVLAPGEQFTFVYEYIVRATPGDYLLTATFNPFFDPGPPPPQTLSVVTTVEPSAELQAAWSHTRSGADIVRTATARSFGPSTASGVVLTLTWQGDRGTPTLLSVTPSQGTCDPPAGAATRCALGELSPFGTATVDLVFRGRGAARGLTTTAEVTSLTFDPDLSTNTATLHI